MTPKMVRLMLTLGLFVTMLISCARAGSGAEEETVEAAAERLRSMIDDAVAEVTGDLKTSPGPELPPVFCEVPPNDRDTYSAGYAVRIDLPDRGEADGLIDRTRSYLEQRGYEVRARRLEGDLPALFAASGGYEISLQVVRAKGLAELRGNTPCLPRAASED